MDAFYASVALRDRPDLVDTPVVVGGGQRGVVLSANYLARERGISSAMPMTRARRLCPGLVVLPPDFAAVEAVSASVMQLFERYTPAVQAMSLDEAALDVTGCLRSRGPREIAEEIRARVHDEHGITCSVGVASSMTVAKMASNLAKPDGVVVVPPERVTAFLHPLEVEQLWGVGEKTGQALRRLGLTTVGAVAHTPVETLRRALGPAQGGQLHRLAWGRCDRRVEPRRVDHAPDRSMGANETFGRDTDDAEVVLRELLRLSGRVGSRMRTAGVVGRTVTLTVRFADFTTITRSRTLAEPTDVTREIHHEASRLFRALGLQRARVRLVGVRVERLRPREGADRQLLLGEREQGWAEADQAADRVVRRFGRTALTPASLLAGDPRRHGLSRPVA
ncbi:DNA polymerase IV [Nocardioidaceae bacterium]|nr:DNA polymerase IV [Nocardioidaceae bacterium]